MKGEEKQIDEEVSLHKSQYFSSFSYITALMCAVITLVKLTFKNPYIYITIILNL